MLNRNIFLLIHHTISNPIHSSSSYRWLRCRMEKNLETRPFSFIIIVFSLSGLSFRCIACKFFFCSSYLSRNCTREWVVWCDALTMLSLYLSHANCWVGAEDETYDEMKYNTATRELFCLITFIYRFMFCFCAVTLSQHCALHESRYWRYQVDESISERP